MFKHATYLFLFLFIIAFSHCSLTGQPVVTDKLQHAAAERGEEDFIRVNLRLSEQYDSQQLYSESRLLHDRNKRREHVVNTLKSFSEAQQADLLAFLESQEASGLVRDIRPLWVANVITAEVKPGLLHDLSARKDLARIDYDKERQVIMTGGDHGGTQVEDLAATPVNATDRLDRNDLAWNVTLVNADQVWDLGFTGQDVVVAVMDTGINYNHLDIADNMWHHEDYPGHGYNFVNDSHSTMDYQGHGTHCAGTVAGDGSAGTGTGMAPGATIMNLQVLGSDGGGTESAVWTGIQFAIDYGAHIMSLSLGWQHSWGPDRPTWRATMNNALSAGLIASVASGNEGGWGGQPPPSEVRTPGDVPPPWTHPDQTEEGGNSAVVSVGATNSSDGMAGFSSKGPVTWQNEAPFNDYNYNPGQGLIRPDIVAPGANVPSLIHNSNTGYTSKSGTSMAAPAVAGIMALMLEKNPNLLPEEISQIIEETAMEMSSTKSNTHGSGRIDALAAIQATPYPGIQYVTHQLDDSAGNDDGHINPGEFITLNMSFVNPTETEIKEVEAILSTKSKYITVIDSIADLGDFDAAEEKSFNGIFSFETANNIPGNYEVVFAAELRAGDDPEEKWRDEFVEMAHAPYLDFANLCINDNETGNGDGILYPGQTAELHVTMANTGQMTTEDIKVHAISDSQWLAVLSHESQDIPPLNPEDSVDLAFEVTTFHDTPVETIDTLIFEALTGAYAFTRTKEILIGAATYYSNGDIPSTYNTNTHTGSNAAEPGELTVTIPEGATITGVDVEYNVTSHGGAWMSEQRSFLRCVSEGGETEPEVYVGNTNTGGTITYHRTGLDIANAVEGGGDIDFELHVFRTWGGSGSNTQYVYVPDDTWKIIVHYQLPTKDIIFRVENQVGQTVKNAAVAIANTEKYTDDAGEVQFELPEGISYYSVEAEMHLPVTLQAFEVTEDTDLVQVPIQRVFQVTFDVTDIHGNEVHEKTIIFDGDTLDSDTYVLEGLMDGTYDYSVAAEGYQTYAGEVKLMEDDVILQIAMNPYYSIHFEIYDYWGEPVEHAIITIRDKTYEAGMYDIPDVIPGVHDFAIVADHFNTYHGEVEVQDQDVMLNITLEEDGTDTGDLADTFLELFPNPASESVTVRFNNTGKNTMLKVFNHKGQTIKSLHPLQVAGETRKEIFLGDFSPGVYFITMENEERVTRKLIVK